MLAAIYAFYRYVKAPSVLRIVAVGFAVGLTMTAKFTGVFIVLSFVIAAIDYWLSKYTGRVSDQHRLDRPRQHSLSLC
jgi:4-amino-4-deoxy-L-arabinose transferase-like glycosyltransferase